MIWYFLIAFLLLFLFWLMLVPVSLYTNTESNRYVLRLPGIFQAAVVPDGGLFIIRGWILFIPYRFNPFEAGKSKQGRKVRKQKKPFWQRGRLRTTKGALRAFRIRRLEADIDTDDFTLNAWLVPVFSALNGEKIRLQVNFSGRQSILLDMRVTLGVLLWNMIKAKF